MPDDIQPDETAKWLERLESAKQGDQDSLGWLLKNYWRPLWDNATDKTGVNLARESGQVQETLVDAQNSLHEFHGHTPNELKAWLHTVFTSNIRDAWRTSNANKRQAESGTETDGVINNFATPLVTPSAAFISNEGDADIEAILLQLPDHYRTILRLRHWDSMTFEAIARLMNKSTDSIRQLWYRSIELFAEILEQHDSK